MEKLKLKRVKQCEKCPWKVDTDPHDIVNYSVRRHKKLKSTIASGIKTEIRAMSCHEFPDGEEDFCIGWLYNQLGVGNNIMLRMMMRKYDLSKMEIVGEQHEKFEDTLPE